MIISSACAVLPNLGLHRSLHGDVKIECDSCSLTTNWPHIRPGGRMARLHSFFRPINNDYLYILFSVCCFSYFSYRFLVMNMIILSIHFQNGFLVFIRNVKGKKIINWFCQRSHFRINTVKFVK